MTNKPETWHVRALILTPKQIEALTSPAVKVEMFVSSRLGAESLSDDIERDSVVEEGESV
ncbi:MAG: hypothetical protein JWL86_808 [Rhizobium sp.]|nr:hypothetical protein [Rhizobium sp.]